MTPEEHLDKVDDPPSISIEFLDTLDQPDLRYAINASIEKAKAGEKHDIASVNVVLGTDDLLKQLNNEYRGFDEPTDVLSFDLGDGPDQPIEGDIYISLNRAEVQAAERGEIPKRETLRLAVHGFLHLCGWDHDDDESLRLMVERGEGYIVEQKEGE